MLNEDSVWGRRCFTLGVTCVAVEDWPAVAQTQGACRGRSVRHRPCSCNFENPSVFII
jgi:hypothetical protein